MRADGAATTRWAKAASSIPEPTVDPWMRTVVGNQLAGTVVVELSARDTGIGIPEEALEHLFDAFTQAELHLRRYGGTGLGLAISGQLVELMGGRLTAVSEVGTGSAFSAVIPFVIEDPVTATGDIAELAGRRVLIVDDNATSRHVLHDMVGGWGCTTTDADGADRALDLLRDAQHPFDAVILDLNMPRVDGYGLIRMMRDDPGVPNTPIVMLTSSDHRGGGERTRQASIVANLTKAVRSA
jgi:two-component system sensor histidine kinase/response regulator